MEATLALTPAVRAGETTTDEELVELARRGDDRAFEILYQRYHRRISSYVFGMVKDHARAEDVTQDVFMSALRRMRDSDRQIVFKPWIYEIAKNACIDQFRRQRRAEEVSFDAAAEQGSADYGRLTTHDAAPHEILDGKQRFMDLQGALGGLSEGHHQILVMREFEGLSYREIGDRLGMSRPSVESTLFRARKRLSEEYGELVSGQRCQRIQTIISAGTGNALGVRERRRMTRHLSYCQPCRRHALTAGATDLVPARPALAARAIAFLPLPAFLRRRFGGRGADAAMGAGAHGGASLAQLSAGMAPMADPAFNWAKTAAAAAAVALAGAGGAAVTGNLPGTDASPKAHHPSSSTAYFVSPSQPTGAHKRSSGGSGGSSPTAGGVHTGARPSGAPSSSKYGAGSASGGSTSLTSGSTSGGSGSATRPSGTGSSEPASTSTPTVDLGSSTSSATGTSGTKVSKPLGLPPVKLPSVSTTVPTSANAPNSDPLAPVGSAVQGAGQAVQGAGQSAGSAVQSAGQAAGDAAQGASGGLGGGLGGP